MVVMRSLLVAAALLAAFSFAATDAASTRPAGTSVDPRRGDPLTGEWRTAVIPMTRIRSVLVAAGYSAPEIDAFLREFDLRRARSLRFDLDFYRVGASSFVRQVGWDPARGAKPAGKGYPYGRQSPNLIDIVSADRNNRSLHVFAYNVKGKRLRLRFVSSQSPDLSKKRLRLLNCWLYAVAASPYTKVA